MTVAGNFLNPQWNAAASNMVQVAADNWQFDTALVNITNLQFKFAANGGWTTNWGENNGSQAQFTVPLSGTGKPGGNSNILVNGTFNGTYRFTFNDQTLAYGVVPLLASPYATMAVAGTFNGWDPSVTNMILVTNSTWSLDAALPAGTNQFKFAANGAWLPDNWGDSSQTQTNLPLAGTAQSLGGNISANVASNGVCRFTFNDQTFAYSLTALAIVPPQLNGRMIPGNQTCALTFTDFPGTRYTVLTTTNLTVPLTNWSVLGTTTEAAPGQFQFLDQTTSNAPVRYYRVRSP
jgi:hypothetical protein